MTRIQTTALLAALAASVLLTGCEPMWWNPLPRKEDRKNARNGERDDERNEEYEDYDETAFRRPGGYSPAERGYGGRENLAPNDSSYASLQPRMEMRIPGVPDGASTDAYASRAMPEPYPERERVIYDPRVDGEPPPEFVDPARITKTVYSANMKPFAGAMVGRSNPASVRSMESKQPMRKPAKMPGQGNHPEAGQAEAREMIVSRPMPAMPAPSNELSYDEDMRLDEEVRSKAAAAASGRFSAMAAPGGAERRSPPRAEAVEIPLNRPAAAPVTQPAPMPESVPSDEIFTPDLFLS